MDNFNEKVETKIIVNIVIKDPDTGQVFINKGFKTPVIEKRKDNVKFNK